jgi:hypothetical protein
MFEDEVTKVGSQSISMDPNDAYQLKTTSGTRNPKVLQNSNSKSFLATKGYNIDHQAYTSG